ncbi:2-hydroxychromene-2-carboxylate isomerase [Aliikangiella coralliicola]|uniref:2-hydroxychromene-2-carboxylate isomerase n=1 Tax=Aliikangiella coralliicola TaxID=2592383 RepID=A0A545UI73_9GAMM|nr:2-hydroxychromene-2-carboxylate isomerase [Aliikangiella coralliicola]TQV89165.1 2-hydroxychromene-2-carboxylate isomerase [Aliikangiella coralliicola]
MKLVWYFDFISPFAYLQHCQFDRLPTDVNIEYKPILFAGLLNHWQNVGPAEIAPKRKFTYKHCYWQARRASIPFKMPPAHPFNSLFALRLAIATNNQRENIQIIFESIWKEGLASDSNEAIRYLEKHLQIKNLDVLTSAQSVKDQLRINTEEAANNEIFGVPTFMVKDQPGEIFWGLDAFEMLLDYLHAPTNFRDEEMDRVENLPIGVQRKR